MVLLLFVSLLLAPAAQPVFAQRSGGATSSSDAAQALQEILIAACRHDETAFANQLTSDNAAAYRALPQEQQVALLRRMVLLDDPGKPLLSSTGGNVVVRCDAAGSNSELRFGAPEIRDNLAFIPVTVPEGDETQSVRFGLVKEGGQWKLLSVGLLLVDIPALARQWQQSELEARERDAIAAVRKVANALKAYQRAYGNLPETLDQLGPAPSDGASPEAAGLLDADLAKGLAGGYRLRYSIVPATGEGDISERNRGAGFALAATPAVYGKDGRRSFFLDDTGVLRGSDKNGLVATADDPRIDHEQAP
jgi:type II secretory pathway pseudopilin PulG